MRFARSTARMIFGIPVLLGLSFAQAPFWGGYGGDAQHSSLAKSTIKVPRKIVWSTPVDLDPQYSGGGTLYIHYGSPSISMTNVVIYSLKTGSEGGYTFNARRTYDSKLLWSQDTGYVLPDHGWTPSVSGVITPFNAYAMPGAGGGIWLRDQGDAPSSKTTKIYFYGQGNHDADPETYDDAIRICTPLTCDPRGNIYFGYRTFGTNPLNIRSGIAVVDKYGKSKFIEATSLQTIVPVNTPTMNCAPALSPNNASVYMSFHDDSNHGCLVELDAKTLKLKGSTRLVDPVSGFDAFVSDDGTASPTVGSDGDVFFGVLEQPWGANHFRGRLLHFDGNLNPKGANGAFGWDDSPSIVPSTAVPSYHGSSKYLILSKYNNYAGAGGDGVNKLAILDPNATQIDTISGATVMKEVISVAGVTADAEFRPGFPNAVREWCVNAAAIDASGKCAYVNCEDGVSYRWDFTDNTLKNAVRLTNGVGEAYTPTLFAKDGTVFYINNATLFAVRY